MTHHRPLALRESGGSTTPPPPAVPKKVARDPRFESLSGAACAAPHRPVLRTSRAEPTPAPLRQPLPRPPAPGSLDNEGFRRRYAFLYDEVLPGDKERLQKALKARGMLLFPCFLPFFSLRLRRPARAPGGGAWRRWRVGKPRRSGRSNPPVSPPASRPAEGEEARGPGAREAAAAAGGAADARRAAAPRRGRQGESSPPAHRCARCSWESCADPATSALMCAPCWRFSPCSPQEKARRKAEKEAVKGGKRPFYLKKGEPPLLLPRSSSPSAQTTGDSSRSNSTPPPAARAQARKRRRSSSPSSRSSRPRGSSRRAAAAALIADGECRPPAARRLLTRTSRPCARAEVPGEEEEEAGGKGPRARADGEGGAGRGR